MSRLIIPIGPADPAGNAVDEAVIILARGGVVAYPTETFYGLGADGTNESAIGRIFEIKGRGRQIPLSVIIGDRSDLGRLVAKIPEGARKLADAFWPGAITILFDALPDVPGILTAGTGKIGVRLSSNPVAALLARRLGRPLTATSANPSGFPECTSADEVLATLGNSVDAVIDGGVTPGGSGSTIIDVTVEPPLVIREGVLAVTAIDAVLGRR
ncbi:MAG: L-threonylcarbamoyladenylate synthase [Syntrophales bacterium]|jgi:L-threonylcarbamoyladenylate synthase|nr:L-threonylcarbamoyladenylate synthase [Syntrophales bacterium]MCK9528488.1 L-threonylcarbamoyladenylate synthase [Syntrophales bacterium]MDX9923025.1 L-threonylcarbamoyladenylate synthase [Syntrophales bacterium]